MRDKHCRRHLRGSRQKVAGKLSPVTTGFLEFDVVDDDVVDDDVVDDDVVVDDVVDDDGGG